MLINFEKKTALRTPVAAYPNQPRPASKAVRTVWKDGLTDILHSVIGLHERDRMAEVDPITPSIELIDTSLRLRIRRAADSSDTGWWIETVDTGTREPIIGWGEGAEEGMATTNTNGRLMQTFAILARRIGIKDLKTDSVETDAIDERRSARGAFWDPLGNFTGHDAAVRAKYLAHFGLTPGDVTVEALLSRGNS